MEETGFKLEGRVLCPDDACIGVIGPDRKCKVCGAAYAGDEPIGEEAAAAPPSASPASELTPESPLEPSADPDERVCCTDESCIGIIGADGKCGTCGKSG